MTRLRDHPLAGDDELAFLPLGGSSEIGMNLNLYTHAGRWLMVDLGITFGDDTTPPGVDVILPDIRFIEEYRDELDGIVLTHGHEDHIGAVPYLWHRLRCPLYATPFTATLVRKKLFDAGLLDEVTIHDIPMSGQFKVGPFDIELITLTHSIPEPNAVVIRTPLGAVLHTGDWKFDPDPLVGETSDYARLRQLGDEGVLAMVCDSTNVFVEGSAGSEADVRTSLTKVIGECPGRVAVTCFASNVARMETIGQAAATHGRQVALVGRSLGRIEAAARANGFFKDMPPIIPESDLMALPPDKVLLICTGSQGEPRAALSRIAIGQHPTVELERGDTVIFSSRVIPGNERRIGMLHNNLVRLGVQVITQDDAFIHVSGHPARDELAEMYQFIRPQIAIPVHGEPRHIAEHVLFAEQCQVPQAVAPHNGTLIRLAPGKAEIIDEVFTGRLALDGTRLVQLDSQALRDRRRLTDAGAVAATLVFNRRGELAADPSIVTFGLLEEERDAAISARLTEDCATAVDDMSDRAVMADEQVEEVVRRAIRRVLNDTLGKRPRLDIQIVRV